MSDNRKPVEARLFAEYPFFINADEENESKILDAFRQASGIHLPVVKDGKPIGILDLFDYMDAGKNNRSIGDVMRRDFASAPLETDTASIDMKSPLLIIIDDKGFYLGYVLKETLEQKSRLELLERRYHECLQSFKDLNEEYDALIESSYDGITVTDGQGVTLKVNHACERITGIQAWEEEGRHMEELVSSGFYSESVVLKVLKQRKQISILQTARNGKEIMVTGTPVIKNEKIVRVIVNVRDLSELTNLKNELEDIRQKNKKYKSELQYLRQEHNRLDGMVVQSKEMEKIVDLAVLVAPVDTTVLIQGESGVGKEVIARLIHNRSNRKDKPLVKIDCSAIPETLLESELFGYEKGAFTGANREGKMGIIELAQEGTLFLDEIGDMPVNMQVKLLRVLQDREIHRIGGQKPIQVDIRIIAATNKDLKNMVEAKTFREDLYYRLNVVPINIPPLRKRRKDIAFLCMHFMDKYNQRHGLNKTIKPEVLKRMIEYDWPGNVRELENMVERLIVTSKYQAITMNDMPRVLKHDWQTGKNSLPADISSFKSIMDKYEKELLLHLVEEVHEMQEIADILQLDVSTVRRKLRKHHITLNNNRQ